MSARAEFVFVPTPSAGDYLELYRNPNSWTAARNLVDRIGYTEVQGVGFGSGFFNCRGTGETTSYIECNGNDFENLTAPDADLFGKLRMWGKKLSIGLWPTYPQNEGTTCAYSSALSIEYGKALIRNAVERSIREEDISIELDHAYDYSLNDMACATYESMGDAMANLIVGIKAAYPRIKISLSEGYEAAAAPMPTVLSGQLTVTRYRTQMCPRPFPPLVYIYDPPLADPCEAPPAGRARAVLRVDRVPGLLDYHSDLRRRVEELKRQRNITDTWNVDGILIDANWGTLSDIVTLDPMNDVRVIEDWNRIIEYTQQNRMTAGIYLVSIHVPQSLIDLYGRDTRRVWMLNYTDQDFFETTLNKVAWIARAQRMSDAQRLQPFDRYFFTSWATENSVYEGRVTISVPSNIATSANPYGMTALIEQANARLR